MRLFKIKKMKGENNSRDSIELDANLNEIGNDINNFNSKENCVAMDIPFEKCITLFDTANYDIIKEQLKDNQLKKDILMNMKKTPMGLRTFYTNQIFDIIKSLKKTNVYQEFPRLPFGQQLSDTEFIELLKKSVSFANYKLDNKNIEKMKNRLFTNILQL